MRSELSILRLKPAPSVNPDSSKLPGFSHNAAQRASADYSEDFLQFPKKIPIFVMQLSAIFSAFFSFALLHPSFITFQIFQLCVRCAFGLSKDLINIELQLFIKIPS